MSNEKKVDLLKTMADQAAKTGRVVDTDFDATEGLAERLELKRRRESLKDPEASNLQTSAETPKDDPQLTPARRELLARELKKLGIGPRRSDDKDKGGKGRG